MPSRGRVPYADPQSRALAGPAFWTLRVMSDAHKGVWQQVGTNDQTIEPSRAVLLWISLSAVLWALILGALYWLF